MSQTKAQLIDPVDGSLVNADINASAAIAGTKISPDFGSQNIVTTGSISGAAGTLTGDLTIPDTIVHTGDTNTKIRFPAADTVSIETGGSERLRIDSSGRLQQGSDTSNLGSAKLNIVTGGEDGISIGKNATGNVSNGDVLGTYAFQSSVGAQTTNSAEASIKGIAAQDSTGSTAATDLAFFTKPSGTGPGSSPTERLRISSSGKVGIGLNSPSRMLQVKSSANNSTHISLVDADSTNEVFRVGQQSDGDGFLQLLDDSGAVQIGLEATGNSFFVGGDVGIGVSSPLYPLHVKGTVGQSAPADFGVLMGLSSNDDYAQIQLNGDTGAFIDFSTSGVDQKGRILYIHSSEKFEFFVNSGKRAQLTGDGLILNGTDTAAANALDDYEEGTWTPAVNQGIDGGAAYQIQRGHYVKVGQFVHATFFLRFVNSATGSTGNGNHFRLQGLPFNTLNASPSYSGGGLITYTNVNFSSTSHQKRIWVGGNSSVMEIYHSNNSSTSVSGANNSADIYGFVNYRSN